MKPSAQDLQRYRDNFLREQDGIALYHALAKAEKDPARSEIFRKLAKAEERHAARWSRLLKNNGAPVPPYKPGWRILVLGWLSRRFGTQHILPVVTGLESRDQDVYRGQAEAVGIPAEERSHMRTLRAMQRHGEDRPESILDLEGWHRTIYGGSLRAAVFGANDGLLSNFSLVMGIAGANAEPRFVLLAGIAGLLAGASSMAAGEFVSVQSQRELYEQQIAVERQELEMAPEEEKEELSLIYQAKGVPSGQAEELAERILSNPQTAIDTLAREELGLDPASLGSPWVAAASSFFAFATGAVIPVIPYLLLSGSSAFVTSAVVCGAALFILGLLVSLFTGKSALFSGLRMLGIGAIAAAVTYFIGKLLGVTVS
ncbi:MAG TPA: VIT1/CCC1 family protein [Terriglobia bacterium]|nr:VIT1/CCC1 family protein [Terriglobia bacterium]